MSSYSSKLHVMSHDGYKIPAVLHSSTGDFSQTPGRRLAVMLHGIFSDKDERGRFVRLADRLVSNGCDALRIDYRGHGENPIKDRDTTIAGMVVDVASVVDFSKQKAPRELSVIASSFGASILLLYVQTIRSVHLDRIVLLNPVVDYRATLLQATLEWGRSLFSEEGYKELADTGYITLEEGFKMKLETVLEMSILKPYEAFEKLRVPTLVMHGDRDTKVPYQVTKEAAERSQHAHFRSISGADHAFKTKEHERETHTLTTEWICGSSMS